MSIKETIIGITNSLAVAAMEGYEYSSWDNDFRAEQINERINHMKEAYQLNLLDLTEQDCKDLMFHTWTVDETEIKIYVIPFYLLQFIDPDYVNFTCIDGSVIIQKSQMDNDHRYGSLAYGLTFN